MAVRWMPSALAAYEKSLLYIASQDDHTASGRTSRENETKGISLKSNPCGFAGTPIGKRCVPMVSGRSWF